MVRNGGWEGPERGSAAELGEDECVGIYYSRIFEGEYLLQRWEAWRGREGFQRREVRAEEGQHVPPQGFTVDCTVKPVIFEAEQKGGPSGGDGMMLAEWAY